MNHLYYARITLLLLLLVATLPLSAQKKTTETKVDPKSKSAVKPLKGKPCAVKNVFKANAVYGKLVDQDGNTYKTIRIGAKEWMAENLKASHYRNGNPISVISSSKEWSALTTGATCWYNNDSASNSCAYGKLYNWYAVADERNVCPTGWHVPTDEDWTNLVDELSGSSSAGGRLKSAGLTYWTSVNESADNSSGFSALPGGNRFGNGPYFDVNTNAYWWTSTATGDEEAWFRGMFNKVAMVDRNAYDKKSGFSVRCVKD